MSEVLSKRIAALTDSATMAITARANELKAAGRPVIGFGAGEPDFPTPPHIVEAARVAAGEVRAHRYSPARGLPELRRAVVDKTLRDSGLEVGVDWVTITLGAKGAVYAACTALLDPGDEALLPSPYWVSYPEMVALAGGITRTVPTTLESGFKVSVDQLESARTERTKLLIFTSPSNPTGVVYTPDEVREIGQWAEDAGIWVITDEIYEDLVYGDAVFSSMPVQVPGLKDRCVVVNGVAKTHAMTGWRVGWLIAPPEVAAAVGRYQSHATANVANVSQLAALAALEGPRDAVEAMVGAFAIRRDTMTRLLGEIPGVELVAPDGAFYAFPRVEGLLGLEVAGEHPATSLELARVLLEKAEIAVVPGEAFGAPGHLRLSFALGDADLAEGLDRWRQAVG